MKKVLIALTGTVVKCFQRYCRILAIVSLLIVALSIGAVAQKPSGEQSTHSPSPPQLISDAAKLLSIDTKELPAGKKDVQYPETALSASGGKPPYTWSFGSGSNPPDGLKIDNAQIKGIPTKAGQFPVSVQLTDSENKSVSKQLTISIGEKGAPGSIDPSAAQTPSGEQPTLSLSPPQLYFGDCEIGMMTAAKAVSLTNDGKVSIIVDKVSMRGDFTESHLCSEPLDPGKSCIISIKFSPTEADRRDGALVVNYKVPNVDSVTSSKPVELRGRGTVSLLGAFLPTLAIVLIYLVGLILVRWNLVARPARAHLRAHVDSTKTEFEALANVDAPNTSGIKTSINALLSKVDVLIDDGGGIARKYSKLLDLLFWSRGGEMAGWNYLHAAKVQSTALLPEESVRAALECAEDDLRRMATPNAVRLADRLRDTLTATTQIPLNRWRALLAEARSFIYEVGDIDFSAMSRWHNKTMWLILCGLLLIVCLSTFLHNGLLFLVGATGGLLSRLTRSLSRQDVPTDYGAYWTTLFLSPVVGALTGWAGILGLILLAELKILGIAITIDWMTPYSTVALGLALALGFSERFFTSIQASLEEKLIKPPASVKDSETELLTITTTALPPGEKDAQYTGTTLAASGGKPPYTWSFSSGSKPPDGLKIDNGQLKGIPTKADQFPFSVQVIDSANKSVSKQFTISIGEKGAPNPTDPSAAKPLSIDTKQLPGGTVGQPYPETTLAASGGKPPYTWELTGDTTLPKNLDLDKSSGKISGTPTAECPPIKLTLQVTDKDLKTAAKEYTIQVKI